MSAWRDLHPGWLSKLMSYCFLQVVVEVGRAQKQVLLARRVKQALMLLKAGGKRLPSGRVLRSLNRMHANMYYSSRSSRHSNFGPR